LFETNKDGLLLRTLVDNNDLEISSFDYNFAKSTFYLTDDKNNKVHLLKFYLAKIISHKEKFKILFIKNNNNKKVYKGLYEATGQLRLSPLISTNILGPFKIAIDWTTENIYLAQKTLSRIDVFSWDGSNRTNLITTDLFAPTAIALDPNESFLFVADSGNPRNKRQAAKIERLFMDGSMRHVIVKDKLLEPIGMAVDVVKKRLFWIDRKYDHLETCDYYGLRRFIIASGSQNLPHSLSLDIMESTVYYADTTKMAILKLTRHTVTTDANVTYHYKLANNYKPNFVRVYHETKQLTVRPNPCAQNNSGCEHFCLLSHGADSASTFRCKCRVGYQLRRDLKTCMKIGEFMFVSQSNMIRAISFDQNVDAEARVPVIMPRNGLSRAIDIDYRNNITFFYDPIRRAIFQSK
jgi:hypothetical protein